VEACCNLYVGVGCVPGVLCDANMKYDNDIIKDFVGDQSYPAFTITWFYNVGLFSWMAFVSWGVYSYYKSFGPWVSFTMCGWTIMWIRHGLCALAPFLPAVRLWIGILRFPVLLSSTTIFAVWNFVLMPVIALGILKGEKRKNFFRFANSWRMWQIHVLNILYAYLNCVWAEPNPSPLHMGDVDAAVFYIMTYMLFYYLIMDRLGMQFYPIFSPRTNMCIFSWMMTAGLCFGNYSFWNKVLSAKK